MDTYHASKVGDWGKYPPRMPFIALFQSGKDVRTLSYICTHMSEPSCEPGPCDNWPFITSYINTDKQRQMYPERL
jgi:hypothetical protein